MLHNPYFWLGQAGCLITIVAGLVLLYRFRHQSFWASLPIWAVTYFTLYVLVHPISVAPFYADIPNQMYLYRLAIGVAFGMRAWYWNSGTNRPDIGSELNMARNIAVGGTVLGALFISFLVWKLKQLIR